MRVLIAGAGIGGLTTALLLARHGHAVTLLESVSTLRPLGVGINVLPHAVRVLAALGLLPVLEVQAVATGELCYFNRHGQAIWREPRGRFAGHSLPQLMKALFDELIPRLEWIEFDGEPRLSAANFVNGPKKMPVRCSQNEDSQTNPGGGI